MKYTPDFDFDSLPILDADPSGISPSTEAAPMPSADGQAAPAQNASTPDFDFDSLPILEEPVAQTQTMSPKDFKGQPNMGGATEQALMTQAQGGPVAEKDDGSISSWLKNAWNAFAHNASGRIASSDINWKTQRVMEGVAEKEGGKRVSFLDLPDAELDDYMNSIAPNGFWGYVGNAIGMSGRNDLMKEWDETQGAKIADPAERKKARVQYAMDVAKGVFRQTEEQKQFAQAELQGRGKQWQSGITGGAIQMAGYMAPALAPVVGMPLSAAVEGTARRNELLSDKYETDAEGNVYKVAQGDTRGSALVRGAIGGTVQAAVERYAGKVAGKIIGKIPGAAKAGDKVMSTAIGKAVGKFYRPFGKFFEKTGLDDAPSEFLEEFAQTAIDSTFGLDRRQSEMPDGMVSLERGLDATVDLVKNSGNLLESMLLVQLAGGGLAHMKNRLDANRILRDVVKVDPKKIKGYSTETKWRLIDNHFNGMSEEQKVKVLEAGAKEADNLLHTIEKERLDSFEGRLQTVQAHKDAAKRIYEAREQGKDVSRRMLQEMGIDTELYPTVAERNALADQFLEDRTTYKMRQEAEAAIRRTKMDEVQRGALADEITALGIDAESKEYGGIWLNVANQISDAKELDDPVRRAELVQNALEQYVKENGELNVQFTTDDGATHERSWTYNPPKKETTDETRTDETLPPTEQGAVGTQPSEGQAAVTVPQGAQSAEADGVVDGAEEGEAFVKSHQGDEFLTGDGKVAKFLYWDKDKKHVRVEVRDKDGSVKYGHGTVESLTSAIAKGGLKKRVVDGAETPKIAPTSAPSAEGAITQPKATEGAEGGISQSDGTITPEEAAKERKKGKRIPKTAVKTEGTAPVVEKSGDEATISAPQSVEVEEGLRKRWDSEDAAKSAPRPEASAPAVAPTAATPTSAKEGSGAQSPSVAPKAKEKSPKRTNPAPKTPKPPKLTDELKKRGIQAARILGVESGMDVPELEKTLKQVSKLDSPAAKRKAQALRDLIEYRKAVGQNTDPQNEESSGGKWRGESILSQNNMEDDAAPDGIRPADFAMADPKRAATAIRQNLPKVDEEAADPMNASLNPNALKDPSFVEWAKKKGRAITAKNRRAYDAEQVKAAVPILRRVFPGLKVTYHDTVQDPNAWHAKHPNGIQKLIIDQKSGRTLGWFSPDMKEVHLNPGATVETLAHEVLHAAQDWAKKNSPKLAAALEKIAKECPRNLKQKIIRAYKTADADTLLKEWGAFNFMGEGGKALRAELAKRENASWLGRFWNAVKDIWKDMMAKMGFNRMDLSAIDSMSAKDAMAYLARGMASGMTIGKVDAKNKPPTAKIDMTQKPSKMEWYKTTAFDYRAPLKWLRDEMAKRGVQFSDDSDFYQAARLVVGENQRAFNEAQRRMADYQKMLDDSGIDHSDIVWYMQCLAAKDRNAMIKERNGKENGSGISDREAAEGIARMESEPNGAKYGEIARFLQEMQREGLQFRVDSGLLDAETAQLWLEREPNHVPFRSAVDTESGEHIDWGNTQGQFNKKEFITAKGRQTFADDVVAWMFQEYLDAYTRGNENKLRGMIAEAIEISPSLGVGEVKSQEKIFAHDFSAGNYKTTADGNGVTGDKAKKAVINNSNYRESRKNGDGGKRNVLAFKRGGKAYFIEFSEGEMGEKLQAAVNGRDLKKMPNAWNKLMRGWAATATSLSLSFAIRNGVADSIDLYGNYVGDNGIVGGSKAYGNHLKNVKALSKAIHKYIRTGKIPDGEMGKWIDRYEKAGGLIAGMKREGYEDMSKRLALEFKGKKNTAAAVGSAIMNGIDYMNRFSELANRLAAFKTQVEMGKTDKQAALWSRESTVDFNMKGNVTGITNALWMFSNSTLGASARQIRAVFKSEHGAQLAIGLAALGFLGSIAEWALNYNDEDEREEKGEGMGKDVSEYTRANSMSMRVGGTVYRLPFHAGPFSLIKYAGDCFGRFVTGQMSFTEISKALGEEGLGALLNFLPFGNINFQSQSGTFADDVKTAVGTAVPSIIQPIVQGWGNVDYAGRSIYNESFPGNVTPRSEQGRKGTASVWKWAAKALNEATREDGHLKGYVDLTPEVVKLAGESIGKNALRDVMGIVSVVNMALQNEDWDVRNIPVARDFARTTGGNDSRFYEARNEYRDNVNAYKKGNMTQTEKNAYLKRFPHVGNDWFKDADTAIRRYRKLEDGYAYKGGKAVPHEWPKEKIEEFREKRLKLQAEFIRRMGR